MAQLSVQPMLGEKVQSLAGINCDIERQWSDNVTMKNGLLYHHPLIVFQSALIWLQTYPQKQQRALRKCVLLRLDRSCY